MRAQSANDELIPFTKDSARSDWRRRRRLQWWSATSSRRQHAANFMPINVWHTQNPSHRTGSFAAEEGMSVFAEQLPRVAPQLGRLSITALTLSYQIKMRASVAAATRFKVFR